MFCFLKWICMECQLVSGEIIKNSKPVTPEKLDKHLFSGWSGIQVYFAIAQNSVTQFHLIFCLLQAATSHSFLLCFPHTNTPGTAWAFQEKRWATTPRLCPSCQLRDRSPAGLKVFKRPWILLLASPNPAWRRKVAVQQNQSLSLNQPSQNKNSKKQVSSLTVVPCLEVKPPELCSVSAKMLWLHEHTALRTPEKTVTHFVFNPVIEYKLQKMPHGSTVN